MGIRSIIIRTAFNVLEKSEGVQLNEKIIIKILLVVANVIEYMHKRGVAHRDVKMENVLVNQQGEYRLCDFGSCSRTVSLLLS
jgi:mitogen-activated protein kinase kinase